MSTSPGPRSYRSYEDFEREELQPFNKKGFCLEDLEAEATFRPTPEDQVDEGPKELDFD